MNCNLAFSERSYGEHQPSLQSRKGGEEKSRITRLPMRCVAALLLASFSEVKIWLTLTVSTFASEFGEIGFISYKSKEVGFISYKSEEVWVV